MSIKLVLHPAIPADLTALLDLEQRSFTTDTLSRESYRRLIRSKSALVLTAKVENILLGCAVVFFRQGSKRARLYSLAVDPDHRKRGIALALMQSAEKHALLRGCTCMGLEVRTDNARAISFYTRLGYEKIKEIPGYYEDGWSALQMQKTLTPRETGRD